MLQKDQELSRAKGNIGDPPFVSQVLTMFELRISRDTIVHMVIYGTRSIQLSRSRRRTFVRRNYSQKSSISQELWKREIPTID